MVTRRVGLNIRYYTSTKLANKFGISDIFEEKLDYFKDFIMEGSVLDFRLNEIFTDSSEEGIVVKSIKGDTVVFEFVNVDYDNYCLEINNEELSDASVIELKPKESIKLIITKEENLVKYIEIILTKIQEGEVVINK